MNIPLDNIVSSSELQKNYKKVFNKAKRTKKPIIIMRGEKPQVAIVDIRVLEQDSKRLEELEMEETLSAIKEGEKEFKEGKTKKADSMLDLLKL